MSRINVLDCTLRDGAYLIDKKFGLENISGITRGLILILILSRLDSSRMTDLERERLYIKIRKKHQNTYRLKRKKVNIRF